MTTQQVEVSSVEVTHEVTSVATQQVEVGDSGPITLEIATAGAQGPAGPAGAAGGAGTFAAIQLSASSSTAQTIAASGFNTVEVGSATTNVGGGNWNGSVYTVPVTGRYLITARLRATDGAAARSMGIGVHTSNSDGPYFTWREYGGSVGSTSRDTLVYTRIDTFNANDQLRLFVYTEGQTFSQSQCALTIDRIG